MKLAVEILKKYIKYAGIFVFLYIYSVIDISKVFFIIFNSKIEYLLTSLILTLPQLFLKSYRWMLLMKQQKIIYSPKDSFLIYLSSIYIGVITPGRLGELSKAIYLKKEKNITIRREREEEKAKKRKKRRERQEEKEKNRK